MLAGQLLRETGLYPGQELLMMRVWDEGPMRQVDLMRYLDSDAPTLARMVRRLERAGYVRRTPSPDDCRVTVIEATRASLPLRSAVQRVWSELESLAAGNLNEDDQAAALAALESIEANLLRAEHRAAESEEATEVQADDTAPGGESSTSLCGKLIDEGWTTFWAICRGWFEGPGRFRRGSRGHRMRRSSG